MIRIVRQFRVEILLFLILLACYAYFPPRWADWNQNSRLNLTLAIVDDRSFQIDRFVANTGDYAKYNGHYYSDKAPGTSFLAVPVYAAVRPVLQTAPVQRFIERLGSSAAFGETLRPGGSGLATEKVYFALVLMIVSFATVAVPSALLGVVLYRFLELFGLATGWRVMIALIYGLATPAFPYSNTFVGHQQVAALLFGAFWLVFLIGRQRLSPRWMLVVGFLLGWTLITEYPAALIVAGIGLYALIVLPDRRWIVGAALAGIPPLALMMAYNYAIFGTVLPVGYKYSELWQAEHQSGFMSLAGPNREALWGITFSVHRGLFLLAPVLLTGLAGFVAWWRAGIYRRELAVCIWAVVSFLLFNGSSVMWSGGFGVGPRYLVPMLPFLAFGMGAFLAMWGARWQARVTLVITGGWSLLNVWAQTIGGQSFPQYQPNPLLDYSLPELAAGNVARNLGMALNLSGWASVLPLALFLAVSITVLFFVIRGSGMTERTDQPVVRARGVAG
jgi:MFS family permease